MFNFEEELKKSLGNSEKPKIKIGLGLGFDLLGIIFIVLKLVGTIT